MFFLEDDICNTCEYNQMLSDLEKVNDNDKIQ